MDATAAGDAFRAAFAVGLSEGKSESEAMRFAAAAGALTVTKLGAMPSLPSREDVDKLLGVSESRCVKSVEKSSAAAAKEREIAAVRFASRLNSMKSRMDLFPMRTKTFEVFNLIKRMGRARGISSVFLNFPEHFRNTKTGDAISALDLRDAVLAQNLTSGAVCVRFPEEPYRLGAFTNPDRAVRERAELLVRDACRAATSLDADEVVIWPRYDGYDYNLQADYEDAVERHGSELQKPSPRATSALDSKYPSSSNPRTKRVVLASSPPPPPPSYSPTPWASPTLASPSISATSSPPAKTPRTPSP